MAFKPELCAGCPMEGQHRPIEEPLGNPDGRFLVVTGQPSQAGAKAGRLIAPGAMSVLAQELENAGFSKDEFRFIPSVRCAFNPEVLQTKVKTAIKKICRQHLIDEITEYPPEVIIPLGGEATTAVFGKGTKIMSVRGIGSKIDAFDKPIFPMMDPVTCINYPQNRPLFAADVQSFARFVGLDYDMSAAASVEHGEYVFVDDLQFLIDMDPELIAFDTENTSLRWYQHGCDVRTYDPARHKGNPEFRPRAQILTMQFSVEPGKAYVLSWDHPENPIDERKKPKLRNQLRKLLCDPKRIVVGQNTKYDALYLWKTEGIRFRIGGDTLMLATLIDENAQSRGLDTLIKLYVPEMAGYSDYFDKTFPKDRMWEHPLEAIRGYGGGDADATYRVYEVLEAMVAEDEKLWAHYVHVSLSGLNAFVGLEARGMFVDQNGQMARFKEHLTKVVEEQRAELLSLVPKEIKREHLNNPKLKGKTPDEILSFKRADFLLDILFFHPKGFRLKPRVFTDTTEKLPPDLQVPSTSTKKHLPFFYDICPFTIKLTQYIQNKQLLDTSIIKFEENFVVDGMVRPTYSLTTAVTGRSASKDPNGQNFPKRSKLAKEYGKQFVAPPGWLMIAPDLSQAELRIATSMANEPTMIQIYREGGDIHKVTAAVVMKVAYEDFLALASEVQKPARQKAKAVNFGFLFGMWWKRFVSYAKTEYGVDFTDKDAKEVRENFFKRYKKLAVWHDNVKAFALEHGYVRSYTGRIRHLPMIDSAEEGIQQEALRQAINSPVQETASSLGVMALGRMNEEVDTEYLQPVGFIHDSLIAYVRECHLDWGLKTLKYYMESAPMKDWFGTEIKVPIVADASFGKSFGDQIECPGFTLDALYDFSQLVDKEGKPLLGYDLPAQVIPPNNGRILTSAYTDPDEQEAEYIMNRILRRRQAA